MEREGNFWKYLVIGLSAALSGTLLKWLQSLGVNNVVVNSLITVVITLFPAALTYILLARDQDKKLNQLANRLSAALVKLSELGRVNQIEKNYYANERLLNVERRVIEETGSSMQEIAELISGFDDHQTANVKLKERFRTHAKSVLTLDRAFQFEIEQNFKEIGKVEHQFEEMPHDLRDEAIFKSGKARSDNLSERYELRGVVEKIRGLTQRSTEMQRLAGDTHSEIVRQLDGPSNDKEI